MLNCTGRDSIVLLQKLNSCSLSKKKFLSLRSTEKYSNHSAKCTIANTMNYNNILKYLLGFIYLPAINLLQYLLMWTPDECFYYIYFYWRLNAILQTGNNPQYSSYGYVIIITMLGNDHYHKTISYNRIKR